MERKLLDQINLWHEQDQFSLIIEHIERIPVSERDYDLIGQLARVYNNDARYREAIQHLLSVQERGVNDPLWQYRLGYAYCHIASYEQALLAFERADELLPHDESTLEFLREIRPEADKMRQDRQRHEEELAAFEQSGIQNHLRAASGTYDPATFWVQSDYAQENHVSEPLMKKRF